MPFFLTAICFVLLSTSATSHRVIVYKTADSGQISFCTKLLNSTGSVGCDGPLSPRAGILLTNATDDQIAYIANYTTYYPFIAVLYASRANLTQTLLKLNKANESVAGVLIISDGAKMPSDQFRRSDDVSCPNAATGQNDSHCYRWIDSPDDSIGVFFQHWKFPIFYIDDRNLTASIFNCTSKWNSGLFKGNGSSVVLNDNRNFHFGAHCAAELFQPNYAPAVSAARCLKQSDRTVTLDQITYCDKIRPHSLLVPLMPMFCENTYANRSIFLVVARMDSLTLFIGKSPAADSVFTALIALFSIADALARNRDRFKGTTRQVIFAFYGGESLGNIGSSYHAYELDRKRGLKKAEVKDRSGSRELSGIEDLNLDQVGYLLELNQLATHGKHTEFWFHSRQSLNNSNSLRDRLLKCAQFVDSVQLKLANSSLPLPPSSVPVFEAFNGNHIEAAVITNHETAFTNRYYHSLFDGDFNVLDQESVANISNTSSSSLLALHLSAIATVVTRTVAQFLVEEIDVSDIVADVNLTNQLVECIFLNRSCLLLQHIQQRQYYNDSNLDNTDTLSSSMTLVNLVYDVMSNFTGKRVSCPNESQSDNMRLNAFKYQLDRTTNDSKQCHRFQVFRQTVISPYFLDAPEQLKSRFSQWVLSHHRPSWASPKMRIFLLPTKSNDLLVLGIGISLTLATVFVLSVCFH